MIAFLRSKLGRVRFALVAAAAALSTALVITPARAAGHLSHVESGTVAAVFIVGTLAFAAAFEIWHMATRKAVIRKRSRQDD